MATSQDFVAGNDITGLTVVTGSQINQNVNAGRLADDKGMRIITTDTAVGVPDIPDPSSTVEGVEVTFWERYKWVRRPHPDDGVNGIKEYSWNPNYTIGSLLKWQYMNQTADNASEVANSASDRATEALALAEAAQTAATAATNTAVAAQETADAANETATGAVATNVLQSNLIDQAQNSILILEQTLASITFPLPVAQGGTGGQTVAAAKQNLGLTYTQVGIALLRDNKTAGTNAGDFTNGDWRTRDLNTINTVGTHGVTLNNDNTFDLAPGTYLVEAECPAYLVNGHKARIYNVDDAVVQAYGNNARANNSDDLEMSYCKVSALISIVAARTFRIDHICETTRSADGFGVALNLGGATETYTTVKITAMNV